MTALEQLDPLYHFNTRYTDRLNIIDTGLVIKASPERKKSHINKRKNNPRYKTQPITFDEIKEVEEPVATPSEENPHNSFLSKLQAKAKIDNRLHPGNNHEVKVEVISTDSPTVDLYYDSFPTKLSFLDMPESMHHHHHPKTNTTASKNKAPSAVEKRSNKGRLARRRNNPRYKTQPITFDEIKEVEEPEMTPTNEQPPSSMDILFTQNNNESQKTK